MAIHVSTVATWLSRKPNKNASVVATTMALFVVVFSIMFFVDSFHAAEWMSATPDSVFIKHEFWRAWTSLLIHADWGHLASNVLLFLPFSYFLAGYFGLWFIPVTAFISGGFVNLIVLKTMPSDATLLGVSGVVYWMGATWLTLYLLIDRRTKWQRRLGKVLLIAVVLFMPDKYTPHVSYLSHFVGFIAGLLTGAGIFLYRKKEFLAAEIYKYEDDEDQPAFHEESRGTWTVE